MKISVSVHIGGVIFNVDEDAHVLLNEYLTAIEHHYGTQPDGKEIYADIEARIAELLLERCDKNYRIVTRQMVLEVIEILGQPQELFGETSGSDGNTQGRAPGPRRLYRHPDDVVLAGVCSGIAQYLGVDAVYVRVAFAASLILGGIGALVYIILWVALPQAVTPAQKLEMQGNKVDISGIEKAVREELRRVADRLAGKKTN